MKFTKGFWLNRDGVKINGAIDIRSYELSDKSAVFYIAPEKVVHRGQTLSGPLITLSISSPLENILGVTAYHYKGAVKTGPAYETADENISIGITQTQTGFEITSGKLSCVINIYPFDMAFYYEGGFLTRSNKKSLAYITSPGGAYLRERLLISAGECLYGTGERFTGFVKNGQSVDIYNEDGGTASELAYKNIPFVVSSKGYGVYVNHPENVSFEIGSEAVSKNQFSVKGERLEYFIIGGGSIKGAVSNYTHLTGRPAMPPAWSFGLWLTTSFTTDYNEKTVTGFIDGMKERDIPLSVFHFDCFWMKEYEWCNFTWDNAQFPDAEGMLQRLHGRGLRVCVWINPYIGQKSPLFDEGARNGFLLKREDGGVWQWDLWQPGMGIVDFTNPGAAAWYARKLTALVEMGVDCFKTDFGERIPTDAVWHNGACPHKMHNYYAYLYNKVVFETLRDLKGTDAVVFARSAAVGSQKYPVHWGGDCDATYESMAESLRGGLSLSLAGFGFWSHDIGGFEATATADLYKRWAAFGLLSSHSRLHGSTSYRVPWLFDEEAVDVLRFFTKLKLSLLPYIYAYGVIACETGIPMMRPMVMEYPNDPVCLYLDRQYMLGDNILVAPIFNDKGICEFYLPKGGYTHLITNKRETGGAFIAKTYDYFSLPVYVRDNSIIPMTTGIHIYDLSQDGAAAAIYDDNGNKKLTIAGRKRDGKIAVNIEGKHDGLDFVFHNTGAEGSRTVKIASGDNELVISD